MEPMAIVMIVLAAVLIAFLGRMYSRRSRQGQDHAYDQQTDQLGKVGPNSMRGGTGM
ncbi:MAG: hypothetical protein LCI03_05975 [Actinobacteria bacterium]|nr:hypothetical protein [Actinomycetota bacterium]